MERFNSRTFKLNKNHFDKITRIEIDFSGQPDTIYMNSPLQKPVEFICFIGGIISLWTGFPVLSIYAYGKWFFIQNQIEKQSMKSMKVLVNYANEFNIKKRNGEMSIFKKIRKFINKKHAVIIVINVIPNQNV